MKQIFGVPSNDGIITCKICGCFICNDDFSLLEGFGEDNAPKNTREVLNTDEDIKAYETKLNMKEEKRCKHIQISRVL